MQWGGSQAIIVIEGENNREKYERACPIYTSERVGPQLIIWIRDKGRDLLMRKNVFSKFIEI